ncbi:MAG: helix-turn-helix domain-containing protein [Pseudomonadota bacterium]
MQERRSNEDRRAATRAALLKAARALFVEKGYAETGTPELVAAAAVTRGALYHHFADKAAVLRAVVEAEAAEVARVLARVRAEDPLEGLLEGAEAYFKAMAVPGRVRLLLIEGPAVLGAEAMAEISGARDAAELKAGLLALGVAGDLDALVAMLSAAFDRAALDVARGAEPAAYRAGLERMLRGLVG